MIKLHIKDISTKIKSNDASLDELAELSENFSSSDIKAVTWQAAMAPLKEIDPARLLEISKDEL